MAADQQDDLQIKPLGANPNTATPSAASSTAPAGGQSSVQPVSTTAPAPAQPTPATPAADQQPTNKRAFNLEADVEESVTAQPKPEKYSIPKFVKENYGDLVELIKSTESMDDQEREYWFQILPIMNKDQIDKLKNILNTEKDQLAALDQEYEQELNRLNEKHLLEWKEFESKEKTKAIREAEAANEVSEKQMEEDLLSKLNQL
ncbi:MAG: hypothetical protein ACRCZE_01215 [Candidatus Altimarinota bacterium]